MGGSADLLDEFISASMVENGKPCPAVYLHACEKIRKKPEECLAAEDSPNGVRAAWSAGCHVVMVPDLTGPTKETAEMADYVVKNLGEIPELLMLK